MGPPLTFTKDNVGQVQTTDRRGAGSCGPGVPLGAIARGNARSGAPGPNGAPANKDNRPLIEPPVRAATRRSA